MSGAITQPEVPPEAIQSLFNTLDREAEGAGYHLNANRSFTLGLIEGLLVNEHRYGYWLCPCRLGSGVTSEDLDIICPCDYRDPDLLQYGTCYCALYVSQDVLDGKRKAARIPERRPAERMSGPAEIPERTVGTGPSSPRLPDLSRLSYPVWRCRVCGYLCARGEPPEVCPICKAKKERFERFL